MRKAVERRIAAVTWASLRYYLKALCSAKCRHASALPTKHLLDLPTYLTKGTSYLGSVYLLGKLVGYDDGNAFYYNWTSCLIAHFM